MVRERSTQEYHRFLCCNKFCQGEITKFGFVDISVKELTWNGCNYKITRMLKKKHQEFSKTNQSNIKVHNLTD